MRRPQVGWNLLKRLPDSKIYRWTSAKPWKAPKMQCMKTPGSRDGEASKKYMNTT